jgi:MFS family permease
MSARTEGIEPNASRLLWAGFVAILAAGVGFAIRGGILANWGQEFGFNAGQLGLINGAGFLGFCFGIIIGGVIADRIGYGKLVIAAFVLHVISAVISLAPSKGMATASAFNTLWTGTFIFAVANGTLEAVANPIVARLFPNNRTHYLNILHASWPAGLIIGGVIGAVFGEFVHWKVLLGLFLIPTVIYGIMFFKQHMPKSEASEKGLRLGDMLKDVGIIGALVVGWLIALFMRDSAGPILGGLTGVEFFTSSAWEYVSWAAGIAVVASVGVLTRGALGHWMIFVLFLAHALVGAVELGTDGWIQNITGNILTPTIGKWLFVYTSLVMFLLRFCAHFIERTLRISPVGLLFICSVLAAVGLNMIAGAKGIAPIMVALLVYGVGKTFFWPTMLAVASDRFPRTGAVAISIMGGIGMMSAGQLGSPGLGYCKDRFVGEELAKVDPKVYADYKSEKPTKFSITTSNIHLVEEVYGLDGTKLGAVLDKVKKSKSEAATGTDPFAVLTAEERAVAQSNETADRRTLRVDAFIPITMAAIYLLLFLYFKIIGGYKPVHLAEELTGGIQGPMEA